MIYNKIKTEKEVNELGEVIDFLQNVKSLSQCIPFHNEVFNNQCTLARIQAYLGKIEREIADRDSYIKLLENKLEQCKSGDFSKEINERIDSLKETIIDAIEGIVEAEKEETND